MSERRTLLRRGLVLALGALLALWWAHVHESTQGPAPLAPAQDAPATGHAAQAPAEVRTPAGIDWYRGSVDEAFAAARGAGKPIFLYWGAEWCPPCNQLKATIFRRPDFIARTREFVAVYIDGDGEGAQALQDRFHAMGYPTLIVFDPQGREITRIPGGMDLARYMDVLELALEQVRPVAEIVRRVVDDGGSASEAEWRLLASYSWHQDAGRALGERAGHTVLYALATRAPAQPVAVRAGLAADYLELLMRAQPAPAPAQRTEALAMLRDLLADAQASASVRSFLGLGAGDVIEDLTADDEEERSALLALWQQRLAEAVPAAESAAERLWLLNGEVELARLRGSFDAAARARVQAAVDAEVAAATDLYSRSAVLNTAIGVLDEAGLGAHAMDLLRAQLEDEHFGYYWMLDLAALAEDRGNTEEALAWMQRAVAGAEGRATRIQWGSVYVVGLLRMAPQDLARIESALAGVLADIESQPQALHGRNRQALERMRTALAPWGEGDAARTAALSTARARLAARCDAEFAGEAPAATDCRTLL